MLKFSTQRQLFFANDFLFSIVQDVRNYPAFIEWIKEIEVLSQENDRIVTKVKANFSILRETYTNETIIDKKNHIITINLLQSSIIKSLTCKWNIQFEQQNKSLVTFSADIQMKNIFLNKVIRPFFNRYNNNIISSFAKRAKLLELQQQ